MIQDATVLSDIQASWEGVQQLRGKIQRGILSSIGQGGIVLIADIPHNLPFLHAYSVLNEVLVQLRDEGIFSCPGFFLGKLLSASQHALPWLNFALITAGVGKRNDLAHRGAILPRSECWTYIDALEGELKHFSIIPP